MPYFSIIIPTLNEEQYLPRLLQNLNQQSYKDFEVFVVDARSEDKTAELVSSFKAKYPLTLLSTTRRNVSFQRNLGAKQAAGKVLIFFDADTQIPRNYLEKIEAAFEVKKPHFLTTYIRVDSRKPADQLIAAFTNLVYESGRIMKFPTAYGAMMAIKRGAFEDIGGFDEITSFAEDSQLFQTAIDWNYKYIVLPNPRYIYSLRRYRAEGTLDMIYQYIKLNLSVTINGFHGTHPEYLMGGQKYQQPKVLPEYMRRWDQLLKRLKKAPEEQSRIIKEFFTHLFPEN